MKKLLFSSTVLILTLFSQISNAVILELVGEAAEIGADSAMTKYYANSLLSDCGIIAITAIAGNDGYGQSISSQETPAILKHKIACGANLSATKEGTVYINFPKKCERMEHREEKFNISVDNVIKAAIEENNQYHSFTCTNHQCIYQISPQ